MRVAVTILFTLVFFSICATAQQPEPKPAWNVTLQTNSNARSTLTVQNRCSRSHNFQLDAANAGFLEISQSQVQVSGGQNSVVPVIFNTSALEPRTYNGQVVVICLTCSTEPSCTQDREILPVVLNVIPQKVSTTRPREEPRDEIKVSNISREDNPCEPIEDRCEDLKSVAHRSEAEASGAQTAADAAKVPADDAGAKADAAEKASGKADEMAKDDPSDYKANVDGQDYSSADVAYREVRQSEINRAQKTGEISTAEHESRTKANTTKAAREERLENKERLKQEADEAKIQADTARKAADEAKNTADAAQDVADAAKNAAVEARKAYDDCIDKLNEECRRAKAEQARLAEEEKKAADVSAEREKAEAEKEKRSAARAQAKLEKDKYLVDNIKQLGLIDSRLSRKDAASIYQWLPWWLQTPAALLAEAKTQSPIPIDTLQAFARLYGLASVLLDPCTWGGKQKTIGRLNGMVNPYTGLKYTDGEAVQKMDDMCALLSRFRSKLEEVRKLQTK